MQQLLQLLSNNPAIEPTFNLAGNFISLMSLATKEERVTDTGATHHMNFDFNKLENSKACASKTRLVKLPNGSQTQVTYIGTTTISPKRETP